MNPKNMSLRNNINEAFAEVAKHEQKPPQVIDRSGVLVTSVLTGSGSKSINIILSLGAGEKSFSLAAQLAIFSTSADVSSFVGLLAANLSPDSANGGCFAFDETNNNLNLVQHLRLESISAEQFLSIFSSFGAAAISWVTRFEQKSFPDPRFNGVLGI